MTDTYVVNPTDGNNTRSFSVSPYTTNGETTPVSNVLDASAVTSNTPLLFHGKGKDSYGERIQENFYHLLEHFANPTEPNNPVHGQFWYDTNDSTIKVFERDGIDIYEIDNIVTNTITLQIKGNEYSRYFLRNREAVVLRFSGGFKFSVYATDSVPANENNFVGDYIATSATLKNAGAVEGDADYNKILVDIDTLVGIEVPTSPVNPIIQTIGGWKAIQHVDPTVLQDVFTGAKTIYPTFVGGALDIDVGNNKLFNLAPLDVLDPIHHAVPKGYVDDNFVLNTGDIINGNLTINGILAIPGYADVEAYLNSLSGLPTHNHDADYVKLVGSSMTGFLTLSGPPTLDFQAATKKYVDDAIILSGGVITLDSLTDVITTTAIANDIIEYDGANWLNVPNPLAGVTVGDFVSTITGGTIAATGVLKLDGQPGQNGNAGILANNDAATFGLLDSLITSLLPNGDIYVVSGSYDIINDEIILVMSAGANVVIPGIASGANNTSLSSHTIAGFNDLLTIFWSADAAFPVIPLDSVITTLSRTVRRIQNGVFVSDGRAGLYDWNAELGITYTGGFEGLQIFVNGLKNIANKRAYQTISDPLLAPILHTVATGLLNDATTYTFNINVDGAGNQLMTIVGSTAQNFRLLSDAINNELAIAIVGARSIVMDGYLKFVTDSDGASSSISITDVDLFSSLTSAQVDAAVAGATYDYSELSLYGNDSGTDIQFTNVVPVSSLIEVTSLPTGGVYNFAGNEI